ncbi:Cna protein B-type domain-containing protein [Robiginitalea myxolifaciens]|uniref:Cna protein B-type domain-containing protein n=1 Tax=Robiginitalea myxolifaciens TaxID=400055 RepID=A0A1I6FP35_9FLAO|nr:HYR domain-containing protein [Robiginitalea myxolifaciens]SFR31634.1 Cna protein B-type domain-containing protein [Robiginitalea myxolifaciens]
MPKWNSIPSTHFFLLISALLLAFLLPNEISGQETFLDQFSSAAYNNNDGSQNFSSNWIESGDDGSATGGNIRVVSNQLRFRNLDNRFIYRFVPLAGASNVDLSVSYNANNIGDETLQVYIYNSSTGFWNLISNITGGTGTVNYTLTAAEIASNPAIIFYRGDTNWGGSEEVFVDNVLFTATYGPSMVIDDIAVNEDDGTATFTVTHTNGNASGPFTVDFATSDGTATAGDDYTALTGTLSFNGTSGDTETVTITLLDDSLFEAVETFVLSLTASSDPSVIITDTGTASITDDEVILDDVPLSLYRNLSGNYNYSTAGGTFRTADNNTDPCAITTTSSATLTDAIPAGATVKEAYLFWSHSSYVTDNEVTFEGQNVQADLVYGAGFTGRQFYGYIANVTGIVSGISNPTSNTFDLTDLVIDNSANFCGTATVLGAWSLMVFYEEASLPASTINLYYGFDITQNAGTSFTLDNFYAISAAGSKATFLSYEGDATLDGSSSGSTNPEELSITNQLGANFILTGDGGQTGNNAYNSTVYDGIGGVNNTGIYGLDLDTYDISAYIGPADTQVTANVDVGQDLVISSAVAIRVPSNLISGTVFEDINYPGGSGRNRATAVGVGIPNATVELYDVANVLQATTTTDVNGDYSFGGMSDGTYRIRVVNQDVESTRGGGSGCSSCYAVQTFRTSYNGVSISEITNEVGGANPAATADAATGTVTGAQTISTISIAGGGIGGIDFGFNFNAIVNTNEDGQGSFDQFLINANNLDESGLDIEANSLFDPAAGEDVSIFVIPPTGDAMGRTADTGYGSGYFDIFYNSINPEDLTSDNLIIDGRTQTAYSGDTNTGTVGSGGSTVGTTAVALPSFERPEIQIHRNGGDVIVNDGNNNAIRYVSVYANNNAGIRVDGGSLSVQGNLVGVNALGANAGDIDFAIEQLGGQLVANGNYLATVTDTGVIISGGSLTLLQLNHITSNGDAACDDNIRITGGSNISILQNLIEDAASLGIDAASSGNLTISENTITGSGQDGGDCGGAPENMGIELGGSNSDISFNVIHSNGGAGLSTTGGGTGNTISQNSFYANGTAADALGIDLSGDGVTLNDLNDSDSGSNNLLNFPVFDEVLSDGANLTLRGWTRPGATLELFLSDIATGAASAGDNQLGNTQDYGEGQTYLITLVEGSGSDTDNGSSTYTDADGNTDNTNRFEFIIPMPPGVSMGNELSATATVGGSTSEFSNAFAVDALADLELEASVNNANPDTGTSITFTLTLDNNGLGATDNVTVTSLLPAGLTYVSATPSQGSYNDITGLWDVGAMNNGDTQTLTLVASADGCGAQTLLAEVTASDKADPDSTPNNGVDTDTDLNIEDDPDDEDDGDGVIVTISDSVAPVFTSCPSDIVVNNDPGTCGAVVTWTAPTATDNCSSVTLSTNNYSSGDTFLPGVTTVVYTAADAAGNQSTCSFTITVNEVEDPVVTGPADILVNNDAGMCSANVSYALPRATDNCAAGPGTYPLVTDFEVPSRNDLIAECWQFFGSTVSTSSALNGSSSFRTSNLISTESRSLISPLAYFNGSGQIMFSHRISQARNSNRLTVSLVDEADVATVVYTETYSSNSTQTAAIDVTLTGNYRVRFDFDTNTNATDRGQLDDVSIPALVIADTSGSGACPAASLQVVQTAGLPSGSDFPVGTTTNTFEVTDAFGNTGSYSFDITVTDTEPPAASNPGSLDVYCVADVPAPDPTVVTDESDNCGSPTVSFISDSSNGGSNPEIITRTYRITDSAGNTTDVTQEINIYDIAITSQPSDATVFVGTNAGFSVIAPNADTYQWQLSTNAGASWANISDGPEYSGTNSAVLTVISPEIDKSGYQYRVLVSNSGAVSCPDVISNAAILTVSPRTVITNRRITYRVNPN